MYKTEETENGQIKSIYNYLAFAARYLYIDRFINKIIIDH